MEKIDMTSEMEEIILEETRNSFGFRLQVIAQVRGSGIKNIRYILRTFNPEGDRSIDYMSTLEGFQKLGEILEALHEFAKLPLYANSKSIDELKVLLTAENIKTMAKILRMRMK